MRVLIAFGSQRGGTEGLAQVLGAVLSQAGHTVAVRPAQEQEALQAWDGF